MRSLGLIFCALIVGCGPPDGSNDLKGNNNGNSGNSGNHASADGGAPASAAMLVISDDDFEFNPVADRASSAAATLTVTNRGGQPTSALAVDINGESFDSFVIGDDSCASQTLAAGASCTIAVSLQNPIAGVYEADLRVHGDQGGVAKTHLHGHVTDARLSFDKPLASLGQVLQGTAIGPVTLTLHNGGGATTGTLSIPDPGDARFTIRNDTCRDKTLVGGGSCTLDVSFAAGPTDLGTPSIVILAAGATGQSAQAKLSASIVLRGTLTASDFDYGPFGAHFGANLQANIWVNNTGTTAATISKVSLSDFGDPGFTIVEDHCSQEVAAANSNDVCYVRVQLDPRKAQTDAPSTSLFIFSSNGTGTSVALTAHRIVDFVLLQLHPLGDGKGQITTDDGQVCGSGNSLCSLYVPKASGTLRVNAIAFSGSVFSGWNGAGCTSVANQCDATVKGDWADLNYTFSLVH